MYILKNNEIKTVTYHRDGFSVIEYMKWMQNSFVMTFQEGSQILLDWITHFSLNLRPFLFFIDRFQAPYYNNNNNNNINKKESI